MDRCDDARCFACREADRRDELTALLFEAQCFVDDSGLNPLVLSTVVGFA